MAIELKTPELSRNAAAAFADKWKSYTDEKQHARGFWSDFFRALCGVDDEEIAGIDLAIHAERAYELSDNSQGSVFGISKGA